MNTLTSTAGFVVGLSVSVSISIASLGCGGSSDTVSGPLEPNAPTEGATAPGAGSDTPGAPPVEEERSLAKEPTIEIPEGAEERRIMQAAAPEHVKELDRLVGRFLRGDDASIYEGTFSAHDNMGSLGPMYQDGIMTDAKVVASLVFEEKIYWNGQQVPGWALSVRGPTHRIRIAQSTNAQGATALSLVAPNKSPWGMTGTCSGCVATLAPTASMLAIQNVKAVGKWGNSKPLEVTASGSLTRVPKSQLTFERLVAVADPYMDGAIMQAFAAGGTEMVRGVTSTYKEPTPIPANAPEGKTFHSCEKVTSYRLDWFVDKKLTRYGLRNMSIQSAETCCNEGPPGMCMPRVCF